MNDNKFSIRWYQDGLNQNKILGSKCMECGTVHLPPRPICGKCGVRVLESIELKDEGVIEAYTVVNVPLSNMKEKCPYAIGIIRLDEGPRISGRILNIKNGERLSCGLKVKASFVKESERTHLCFELM